MQNAFKVHRLNARGLAIADEIAHSFERCLADVRARVPTGRELALVTTKLQEACFFAKRAIAEVEENQLDDSTERTGGG